jgi:hypothetical protein
VVLLEPHLEVDARVLELPAQDLLVHLGDAPGSIHQSLALGVLPHRAQQLHHGSLDRLFVQLPELIWTHHFVVPHLGRRFVAAGRAR